MCACAFLVAQKPLDEVHRHAFELQNPCNHLGCFPAVKGWAGASRHWEAEPIDAGGIHPHGAAGSAELCSCRLRLSSCAAPERADNAPAQNKAQLSDHGENSASEGNHLFRSPAQRSGSSPKASRGVYSEEWGKQIIKQPLIVSHFAWVGT